MGAGHAAETATAVLAQDVVAVVIADLGRHRGRGARDGDPTGGSGWLVRVGSVSDGAAASTGP
jgi:hypothetical protein